MRWLNTGLIVFSMKLTASLIFFFERFIVHIIRHPNYSNCRSRMSPLTPLASLSVPRWTVSLKRPSNSLLLSISVPSTFPSWLVSLCCWPITLVYSFPSPICLLLQLPLLNAGTYWQIPNVTYCIEDQVQIPWQHIQGPRSCTCSASPSPGHQADFSFLASIAWHIRFPLLEGPTCFLTISLLLPNMASVRQIQALWGTWGLYNLGGPV